MAPYTHYPPDGHPCGWAKGSRDACDRGDEQDQGRRRSRRRNRCVTLCLCLKKLLLDAPHATKRESPNRQGEGKYDYQKGMIVTFGNQRRGERQHRNGAEKHKISRHESSRPFAAIDQQRVLYDPEASENREAE